MLDKIYFVSFCFICNCYLGREKPININTYFIKHTWQSPGELYSQYLLTEPDHKEESAVHLRFEWDVTITFELRHHLHNSFSARKVSERYTLVLVKHEDRLRASRFPKFAGLNYRGSAATDYRGLLKLRGYHVFHFFLTLSLSLYISTYRIFFIPLSILYIMSFVLKVK